MLFVHHLLQHVPRERERERERERISPSFLAQ